MCRLSRRTQRLAEDLPSLYAGTKCSAADGQRSLIDRDTSAKVRRRRRSRWRRSSEAVGGKGGHDLLRETPTASRALPSPPPVNPPSLPPRVLPVEPTSSMAKASSVNVNEAGKS
ncbi:hypothetical protein HPB48_016131 [Haemaphysalis longicornis]|uniref:Uncharacterized protein n=1 Tax=Haemaphysalis longicornis TaxID=44386 RepID=A0A9J6FT70_HAELO|nr:hypothetical protein HPB48_016131 [Haemaphysalis longicornis]